MKPDCIAPDQIADVLTAPEDDSRRRHLAACPRCRTLVRCYREFMTPAPLPAAADAEGARRELASRLAREIGPVVIPGAGEPAPRGRNHFHRLADRRTILALAAVLAVCASVFLAEDLSLRRGPHVPGGPTVLRGPVETTPALSVDRAGIDGDWRLRWQRPEGAETSRLLLFDRDLQELARLDAGEALGLHLVPADGLAVTDLGDTLRCPQVDLCARAVYARIAFLTGGDVTSRGEVQVLAAP